MQLKKDLNSVPADYQISHFEGFEHPLLHAGLTALQLRVFGLEQGWGERTYGAISSANYTVITDLNQRVIGGLGVFRLAAHGDERFLHHHLGSEKINFSAGQIGVVNGVCVEKDWRRQSLASQLLRETVETHLSHRFKALFAMTASIGFVKMALNEGFLLADGPFAFHSPAPIMVSLVRPLSSDSQSLCYARARHEKIMEQVGLETIFELFRRNSPKLNP